MISVVVPTYKESGNIKALVERAGKALATTGEPFELIIADDNSPDGTADIVRSLQADRPWLRLLVRTTDRGLSNAVIAGWEIARGDVLGCMDADLQHPPEVLTRFVETLRASSADIVVGSRHVQGGGVSDWSFVRRFISWAATFMATLVLPGTLGEVRDPMSGFFLVRGQVIQGAALKARGYKILLEVLAKGHYSQVKEVPFIFEERVEGGSKIGASIMWDYLVHLGRISVETGEAARIAKFALVGLSGSFVNLLLYRWLAAHLGWSVWLAATVSAAVAIINNFAWNEKFTFPETQQVFPGAGPLARRFALFTVISLAGLVLNVGVVELLVAILHFPWLIGVASGIAVAGGWNFFSNSNWTWRPQRTKNPTPAVSIADAPPGNHKPLANELE
jgi:dolichol-phosphate mannosyltransferase